MKRPKLDLAIIALCAATWLSPSVYAADAPRDAGPATRDANAAMSKEFDFADRQDFEDAKRGLVAPPTDAITKTAVAGFHAAADVFAAVLLGY